MTVEELIAELRAMPEAALVEVQIRKELYNGGLMEMYEFREVAPAAVVYSYGRVQIQLDE